MKQAAEGLLPIQIILPSYQAPVYALLDFSLSIAPTKPSQANTTPT
jgi:hypothetical protein